MSFWKCKINACETSLLSATKGWQMLTRPISCRYSQPSTEGEAEPRLRVTKPTTFQVSHFGQSQLMYYVLWNNYPTK